MNQTPDPPATNAAEFLEPGERLLRTGKPDTEASAASLTAATGKETKG